MLESSAYKDEMELQRLASLQCLPYHVVHGEETAGVPTVKLPDNFAEHHDGQIVQRPLFDRNSQAASRVNASRRK